MIVFVLWLCYNLYNVEGFFCFRMPFPVLNIKTGEQCIWIETKPGKHFFRCERQYI